MSHSQDTSADSKSPSPRRELSDQQKKNRAEYYKAWYASHKEEIKAKPKNIESLQRWFDANRDAINEKKRQKRKENPEKTRAEYLAYKLANPEKLKASYKKYRETHKKKVSLYHKEYKATHRKQSETARKKRYDARPELKEKARLRAAAWYAANKDRAAETRKQYVSKNPEHLKQSKQRYYQENKEQLTAKNKASYEQNKDRYLATQRRYNEANKEKIRAWNKQHRIANKEKFKARDREYYYRNIEKFRVSGKAWRQANRDKCAAYGRNREAREKNAEGFHTDIDIRKIWIRQKKKCAVPGCTHPIAENGPDKYHVDHVKALINGGSNWPENLAILCKHHNCAKRAKDEYAWAQAHGMLFVK